MTFFITPFHYTDCFSVRQIGYGGTIAYRSAITDQARELYAWIRKLKIEAERLDKYMDLLSKDEVMVLRMYHFEGCTWKDIAKKCHMSVRTMMRIREAAYHALEECYLNAQAFGILAIE